MKLCPLTAVAGTVFLSGLSSTITDYSSYNRTITNTVVTTAYYPLAPLIPAGGTLSNPSLLDSGSYSDINAGYSHAIATKTNNYSINEL